MRILAVLAREYPGITPSGGAGTMMRDLLESLDERGWDTGVSLATGESIGDLRDPDVIVTHLGGTPRARSLAAELGVPLVHLVHNTSEATVGFLAQQPDLVIFNSVWVRSYHLTRKKANKRNPQIWDNIVVRPPALDYPYPLAKPGGAVTLVNLTANKGTDIFYCLAENFPDQKFIGVEGGYEQGKQLYKYLPNVTFREWTEDINSVYRDTSVLIVPSIYESYSRCAVEAMSRGIPVIGSSTPGLAECLGGIGTYPRKDFGLWCKTLTGVMADWEKHSDAALLRSLDLFYQTREDLTLLDTSLRSLIDNHRLR